MILIPLVLLGSLLVVQNITTDPFLQLAIDPLTIQEVRQWLPVHPLNKADVQRMLPGERAAMSCELYYVNMLSKDENGDYEYITKQYYVPPQALLSSGPQNLGGCRMVITRLTNGSYSVKVPKDIERVWTFRNATKEAARLLLQVIREGN